MLRLEQVVARSLAAHALVRPAESIDAAIVSAAGIYGSAPTSHLGLAARVDGYLPADLERERLASRSILRVPGMRGSVFLAPRPLAPAILALSRPRTARRTLAGMGIDDRELARLGARVEAVLADERLASAGIRARLGVDDPGGPVLTLLLRTMAHDGRIVAAEPVGGTNATAYRHARMADWAPDVADIPDVDEALRVMAPIWMAANGPGSVADLAWWAGVTRGQARAALEVMGATEVAVDGLPEPQWATDEVAAEAEAATSAGVVRLLPLWDAWLMGRRERARILDARLRPFVVDRSGNVTNTVTLDGRVVGTWDVVAAQLRVWLADPVDPPLLEAAAKRLQPVLDWRGIEHVDAPGPLDEGGQNAFRSPLRSRSRGGVH
jgi:hypothetical protein